jgi:DNA invertase Pin-like site-specific DNA recombinase
MRGSVMYGYIRVSSKDQNTARQEDALNQFGVDEAHLFIDKKSGKDFEREQYRKMLKQLRRGDCIVVVSLDRLGRNYKEILEQWRIITEVKECHIIVLDMPLLNTKQADEDLMKTFLSDLVLQVLSYVAELERRHIRRRQAEGIAAAKARGVKFGRAHKPLPENFFEVIRLWKDGDITGREAARRMNVSSSWLYRKMNNPELLK